MERRKFDALTEANAKFTTDTNASFQRILSVLRGFDVVYRQSSASQNEGNSRINAHLAAEDRHLAVSTPRSYTGSRRRHHGGAYQTVTVYHKYNFCVGQLLVQKFESAKTDRTCDTNFEIEFVPPWWMSNIILRCSITKSQDTACGRLGPVLSLTPISINQNPDLLKALYGCDVSQLKTLFTAYSARPTDMIIDPQFSDCVTLIEVGLRSLKYFPHRVLIN